MNKRLLTMALMASLFLVVIVLANNHQMAESASTIQTQQLDKPMATIYYIRVPANSQYEIIPVLSEQLDPLPTLVNKVKDVAVAGINAGFFDPKNKQTTSYVIAQEHIIANPVANRDFVENPDMYPYIHQMLNRSEFRVLSCSGNEQRFAIARRLQKPKGHCKIIHGIQAGPNLFDQEAAENEAFIAFKDGKTLRDPIGVRRRNARSAIGIDASGSAILAMAAMKANSSGELGGVTLTEMADIMRELGAIQALSLDGGSSSALWSGGKTYFGKLDTDFKPVERPIKSAFVVIRKDSK